ncbi:lysoplasmalogenase [Antribacter gilvus]|uniref:lysoplasmalogenase n=1 Tax=Antribacter gilvus TaxID=2304675 RepID=UPI000F795474|nr:lysoplasmalogenase [Antribacter gilvus]
MTTTSSSARPTGSRGPLSLLPTLASRTAALAFVALVGVDLAAELTDAQTLARVAQSCLMPALAATLALAAGRDPGRLVRWVLAGLLLSWLGDALPGFAGDNGFLVMVAFFLLAQVAYIVALLPYARRSPALRLLPLLAYAAFGVAVVLVSAKEAGPLTVALVVYAVALLLMSISAWGLNRTAGIGGLIFLASDSLIALERFTALGDHLPQAGFWVMASYAVGQALLVLGALRVVRGTGTAER